MSQSTSSTPDPLVAIIRQRNSLLALIAGFISADDPCDDILSLQGTFCCHASEIITSNPVFDQADIEFMQMAKEFLNKVSLIDQARKLANPSEE